MSIQSFLPSRITFASMAAAVALAGGVTLSTAHAQTAAPTPAPATNSSQDIVVTARSLDDTARALAECLARNCPPAEDIAATLAHAENQFIAGNYRDARTTTLGSIRRNGDEARTVPIELSGLYRANARIAAHLGEGRAYQLSVLEMRDTLRTGLPNDEARLLVADIEVADSRRALGYADEARDAYRRIARDAMEKNQPRIAAYARIREASLNHPGPRGRPYERNTADARAARATLAELSAAPQTFGADMALLADIMLAGYERDMGDMTRTDALVRRFAAGGGARRPLLIRADPIRLQESEGNDVEGSLPSSNPFARSQMVNVNNRWIDVGFWVESDGRVREVEILRHEGDANWWADSVRRSILSRAYTPLAQEDDGVASPGFYMVERYTLTARYSTECTGTRLRCREGELQVERMDLTVDQEAAQQQQAPAAAPAQATSAPAGG